MGNKAPRAQDRGFMEGTQRIAADKDLKGYMEVQKGLPSSETRDQSLEKVDGELWAEGWSDGVRQAWQAHSDSGVQSWLLSLCC